MVGKNDDLEDIDEESLAKGKIIAENKRLLEQSADQVRQEIKSSFERLVEALKGREKQLLRQVEAIHRQQISLVQSNSELEASSMIMNADLSSEKEFIEQLLNYGKIELSNSIPVDFEPYKAEEYLEASEDFVSFEKSLKSEEDELDISSVIRKTRRESYDSSDKNISINFNCISCECCKFETSLLAALPVTEIKIDDSPSTALTNISTSACNSTNSTNSYEKSPSKNSQDKTSACIESKSLTTENKSTTNQITTKQKTINQKTVKSGNIFFANVDNQLNSNNGNNNPNPQKEKKKNDKNDASKLIDNSIKVHDKILKEKVEHPIQIQQWLQQILAETETEPIIHEIGQFIKIPNTQMYREFPVET